MGNHPNRSGRNAASNPTPGEILAARKASGLSQTKAAELVFSGLRTWQHWESGDRRMHPAIWELVQEKFLAVSFRNSHQQTRGNGE